MSEQGARFCSQCGQEIDEQNSCRICRGELGAEQEVFPKELIESELPKKPLQGRWLTLSLTAFALLALCMAAVLMLMPSPVELAQQRLTEAETSSEEARERYEELVGFVSEADAERAIGIVEDRLGYPAFGLELEVMREANFLPLFFDEETGRYVEVLQEGQTQMVAESFPVYEEDLKQWTVIDIKGLGELKGTVEVIIRQME